MKKVISAIVAVAVTASIAAMSVVSSAAASVKWEAPIDDVSAWVGSTGDVALDSDECWLDGKVEDGALIVNENEKCKIFYPYFKVRNAESGLFEAEEGDMLNFDATLVADETAPNASMHNFGLILTFAAQNSEGANIEINVNKALAATDSNIKIAESGNLLAGSVKASIDLEEAVKGAVSEEDYEAIYGEGGDGTVISARIYLTTGQYAPGTTVTLRELNVTTGGEPEVSSNGSTGGNTVTNSSKPDTTTNSSKGGTTTNSSKGQVSTGENILPIVGIAALAAIATSAVIITKKKVK